MKKIFYLLAFILLFISCKEDTITGIEIEKSKLALLPGETVSIKANTCPYGATAKMIWSSSNTHVATVESDKKAVAISEGIITAKSVGAAEITVTTKDGNYSATCTVQVVNVEPELIMVEGGTFSMGCTDDEGFENEFPVHQVTLSSFKIAKYPVTQELWEVIMGSNPSRFKGNNLPVERVRWTEVHQFIGKLNELTGKNYRLPTEAEWEYAARGGVKSKGYKYSGSNEVDAVAWYSENSNEQTHPVGTKIPNELDIYDMSGNVWEWCSDWYGSYTTESQVNPIGPDMGNNRVIRGGSWYSRKRDVRIAVRYSWNPETYYDNIGFRLVLP